MTSCTELRDQPEPEGHFVQFYGSDDQLLTRNVTRFLAEGLRRGDGLVAIATPEHSGSVARQLREERGYSKAVLEGRLVFLDAQATLDRFMLDGLPNQELFEGVIGEALKGVSARAGHTGIRAYGEMVGLLWKAGHRTAAAQLEGFWNSLLRSRNISLFCGYPIDVFGEDFQVDRVDPLLCAHTHMLPVDDALDRALNRAMNEVLGPRVDSLAELIKANYRPAWGKVPRSEAVILWLKNNLPDSAKQILQLAREYYLPEVAARI